ncbi:MAG: hypothetical protein FD169_1156 [Bacillota bacterium]|nr:MAG: hypothetical protein FD169_1156 [Bacillota bacterium]MBS3951248.1 hypothetical protein [Peptococcaceae bacterium]
MDLMIFVLGVVVGAGVYHMWQKSLPQSQPLAEELELRLQALEEQLAYITHRLDEPQEPKSVRTRSKKQTSASAAQKQDQIMDLQSQGFDSQAIARELGVPHGQVELVTRLFRKGRS